MMRKQWRLERDVPQFSYTPISWDIHYDATSETMSVWHIILCYELGKIVKTDSHLLD